jgi:hypothetical protein
MAIARVSMGVSDPVRINRRPTPFRRSFRTDFLLVAPGSALFGGFAAMAPATAPEKDAQRAVGGPN